MRDKKTRDVVFLLRDKKFSVTTAKHQSEVRSSCYRTGSESNVFHVAHIGGLSLESDYSNLANADRIDHKRNLKHYAERIEKVRTSCADRERRLNGSKTR